MLIERLLKLALLGSEWVLYLLLLLSVLSITAMVERWIFFVRNSGYPAELRAKLSTALQAEDVTEARRLLRSHRSLEARVATEALNWISGGPAAMEDAVAAELSQVRKDLERGSNLLGTLGNNAPFIGLFGTVLGVISAFHALGDAAQNTSAMGGVMAGIAEALVATGVGLFVAIPAVIAYNLLEKRIGEIESDTESLVKLITAHVRANPQGFAERPNFTRESEPAPADAATEAALETGALWQQP